MADWDWTTQFAQQGDDDDDEEDAGGYQYSQWGSRDGIIFLIDCTKPMFQQKEDGDSPFQLCLKCAKNVMQNKIFSSDKDVLGIVFFGTEKDNNPSDFKNIFIFQDLDQPGAQRILDIEELLEGEIDFEKEYGHCNDFSISDALWTCSNLFSNYTQKLGYKRIMLFTCNDNPHAGKPQLRKQAITKASDLHENGVGLELIHINKSGERFDASLFYNDVLIKDDDEDVELPDPAEKLDELMMRVRAKDHKKRAQARIPFTMGSDLSMAVGVYNLVRPCRKPAAVKLYKKTNEEVKTVSKMFLQETGEVLLPQDLKKALTYAEKRICFEKEEVDQMKTFDKPGLKLMGFKPRSRLKAYHHIKPAQFIYPQEEVVNGSVTMFTALLRKCIDRDVIAICRYIPRRKTAPRFVALVPQAEELDEHNVQLTPPGFHLIFLPFADDFRKVKYEEDLPRANQDQVDKAKEIVHKLSFKFDSSNFDNPALQTHYNNVEAMALSRDQVEEVEDHTIMPSARIAKRAGKLIDEFKDLVYPDGYVPGKGTRKRATTAGGGAAAKKAKPEVPLDIDMEEEARGNRLGKLTVPVLKEFIKSANIKASGTKKADLIDAIKEHFGV